MADHESRRDRVKKLLAQDPDINENQLKEFRMNLEASLESWEAKARRVRRTIMISLIAYAASMVVVMLSGGLQSRLVNLAPRHRPPEGWLLTVYQTLFAGGFIAMWLAMIVGGWAVVLYLYKYAPALKRARFDTQTAMIVELRQQIEQLRRELEQRGK